MGSKEAEKNSAVAKAMAGKPAFAKAAAGKPAIFVFTTAYYPFIGGAEIAIQEVVKRLKDEFRFFIFTARFRSGLPRLEENDGVVIRRIGFGFWFDKFLIPFLGFFTVRHFLRKERPVLYWAVMASYASGIPYLINMLSAKRIPVVLTLQEGDPVSHIKEAKFGLIAASWRAALLRTAYLTAISTYLLELGRGFGYRGTGKVIPNGVDVSSFAKEISSEEARILRERLGVASDQKIIITTSRLVTKNAVDIAVKAVKIFKEKPAKVKFLVIGSGEGEQPLRELVRHLGLENDVLFLGDIPHKEIPKYLKISDVFVRPSRSEGLGNSFIEAMAAGVPVIGTMVGGIPDFLEDGKTGLVVKVDDPEDLALKIGLLLHDSRLRERLIGNGRRVVADRYQWERVARDFFAVFSSLAGNDAKPRVLIATGIFPPDIGGPATYSKLIADELPNRGFLVRVLSFGTVRHLPKIIRHFVYFLKLLVAARGMDIIFAQDPVSVGFPAAIAAKLLKKKFLLKVVGDYAWEQYQQKIRSSGVRFINVDEFQNAKFDFFTELRRKIQKFVARRAEKIVVPSEYLKSIVSQWGVNKSKIVVIYNSFEPPELKITKSEARKKLGLSGSIAVSVGRLVPWKGFAALIESVATVKKYIPDFKLYIIGSGPDLESLRLKVQSLKLEDCVYLTGGLPQNDVLTYFAATDVFILNTAYEGFSHTLIEAMAMGVPVITTLVGGNTEIVRNGENGILVLYNNILEISEAIRKVLIDLLLCERLSTSASTTASQFTREKMLAETIEVLRIVLKK